MSYPSCVSSERITNTDARRAGKRGVEDRGISFIVCDALDKCLGFIKTKVQKSYFTLSSLVLHLVGVNGGGVCATIICARWEGWGATTLGGI